MLLFLTTKSASEFLSKNNASNMFLLGFSFVFPFLSFFLCNGDRRHDLENISPIVFQKHPSLFFSYCFGRTWKCLSHHSHLKNTWDSVAKQILELEAIPMLSNLIKIIACLTSFPYIPLSLQVKYLHNIYNIKKNPL